jgi:ApaG protein
LAELGTKIWNKARRGRNMYQESTNSVEITVQPFYLDEQSEPDSSRYVWGYHVTIHNQSSVTIQLLNRYWHITDGLGQVQEVRGPGVIGEQPVMAPGESFKYTSGCPLSTPSGIMAGFYEMEVDGGERFEAIIPTFSLDDPNQQVRLN